MYIRLKIISYSALPLLPLPTVFFPEQLAVVRGEEGRMWWTGVVELLFSLLSIPIIYMMMSKPIPYKYIISKGYCKRKKHDCSYPTLIITLPI